MLFSDRFGKPTYSANLGKLGGKLSAFSSVPLAGVPAMADLELRGRAEGTTSLVIESKLNPLALDSQGKVRVLALPPLSPCAIKYSGYGISRGKLSVDVNYVLLLADIAVTEDAMRELALRRSVAVKDYLASRNLAPARLFLGAAKTAPPDAKWTPRAELNLAMP